MKTYDFLNELAKIVRGEHPAWGGDRILNAEAYTRRFARDMQKEAFFVCLDLDVNESSCVEVSGLPPTRIKSTKNAIIEELKELSSK